MRSDAPRSPRSSPPAYKINWFQTVATWNPVSYMLEGIRSLVIEGWNGEALALGFACAGGVALIALVAASSALRTRMVRT